MGKENRNGNIFGPREISYFKSRACLFAPKVRRKTQFEYCSLVLTHFPPPIFICLPQNQKSRNAAPHHHFDLSGFRLMGRENALNSNKLIIQIISLLLACPWGYSPFMLLHLPLSQILSRSPRFTFLSCRFIYPLSPTASDPLLLPLMLLSSRATSSTSLPPPQIPFQITLLSRCLKSPPLAFVDCVGCCWCKTPRGGVNRCNC